jgi:hypothetical protein
VGRIGSADNNRWVFVYGYEDNNVYWVHKYVASFYWSLAQFTGEQVSVPQNNVELVFNSLILLIAIIIAAFLVGTLTTAMTRLQFLTGQQSSQLWTLRRYLVDQNIPRPLAVRVQQHVQHALIEQKKNLTEDKVDLLNSVSTPLMMELHFEIYWKTLAQHPFFQHYLDINPSGLRKVCHTAVTILPLSKGDTLFSSLEVDPWHRMFFVVSGHLSYTLASEKKPKKVEEGDWLCEPSLWTQWTHCGTAKAESQARLLVLDAERFQMITSTFPTDHACHYAVKFVTALNQQDQDDLSDLDTLGEDIEDFVKDVFMVEDGSWELDGSLVPVSSEQEVVTEGEREQRNESFLASIKARMSMRSNESRTSSQAEEEAKRCAKGGAVGKRHSIKKHQKKSALKRSGSGSVQKVFGFMLGREWGSHISASR